MKRLLPLLAGLAFSPWVSADNLHVDLSTGVVFTEPEGYDEAQVFDSAFSASASGFVYRIGTLLFSDFETEAEDADSHLEIRALYLGAAKEFDLQSLVLEIGAGAVFSRSEAFYLGREIADKRDESPYVNIKLVKPINHFFAVEGDWKYIDDLTGGDLNLVQAGVRFSF